MGKETTGNVAGPAEQIKRDPQTGPAADTGSAPSGQAGRDRATAAAAAGPAPGAGAGGNSGAAAGGKAEKAQPAGLAAVTPPPVPETPKKKQRKPRQKKAEQPQNFNAEQISALIVSVSTIAAARPGLEMFAISEPEALQVATPLSNLIAKNDKLAQMSEHADAVALVMACFVIMAPRVMMYYDAQKQKKLKASGGLKIGKPESKKAATDGDHGKADVSDAARGEIDANGIFAAMPPVAY